MQFIIIQSVKSKKSYKSIIWCYNFWRVCDQTRITTL